MNGDSVGDIQLTVVTMSFNAAPGSADAGTLAAILAKYVVTTRQVANCRNVDLCGSVTRPGRFLVIEKWADPDSQRTHFDGPATESLARACEGLLTVAPDIDLLDAVSAHDLY